VTRISVIHFSEGVMSVTDFIYICNVSAVGASDNRLVMESVARNPCRI